MRSIYWKGRENLAKFEFSIQILRCWVEPNSAYNFKVQVGKSFLALDILQYNSSMLFIHDPKMQLHTWGWVPLSNQKWICLLYSIYSVRS